MLMNTLLSHIQQQPLNGPLSGTTNHDLLEQETVSGSGISWAICTSAPRPRQITMPSPHHSVFFGQMLFLFLSQQRQSFVTHI